MPWIPAQEPSLALSHSSPSPSSLSLTMQVRALERAKLPVPPELAALVEAFKEKVARGEARYSSRYTQVHTHASTSSEKPCPGPFVAITRPTSVQCTAQAPLYTPALAAFLRPFSTLCSPNPHPPPATQRLRGQRLYLRRRRTDRAAEKRVPAKTCLRARARLGPGPQRDGCGGRRR